MSPAKLEMPGGLKDSTEDRIAQLDAENTRFRRLVAELLFENQQLRTAHLYDQVVGTNMNSSSRALHALVKREQ